MRLTVIEEGAGRPLPLSGRAGRLPRHRPLSPLSVALRRWPRVSRRSGGSTISGTRSRPLRSVPASQPRSLALHGRQPDHDRPPLRPPRPRRAPARDRAPRRTQRAPREAWTLVDVRWTPGHKNVSPPTTAARNSGLNSEALSWTRTGDPLSMKKGRGSRVALVLSLGQGGPAGWWVVERCSSLIASSGEETRPIGVRSGGASP